MLKQRDRRGVRGPTRARRARRAGPDWLRLALAASPGLARLHRLREEVRELEDPFAIARYVLAALEVSVDLPPRDLAHLAPEGPLVITANHPFGGLDGLVGIDTVGRRRTDLRVLANPELAALEGIGSLIIAVDPFGGPRAGF